MAIHSRNQPTTINGHQIEWVFPSLPTIFAVHLFSGYIRGIRTLLVIALYVLPYVNPSSAHLYASFVCYIGIAYQLPGAFTAERANLLTSHMKAMGLLDSARIMYARLPLQ